MHYSLLFISLLTLWFLPFCNVTNQDFKLFFVFFFVQLIFIKNAITRGIHFLCIISNFFLTIDFQICVLFCISLLLLKIKKSNSPAPQCVLSVLIFQQKVMNTVSTYKCLLMSTRSMKFCSWRMVAY